MSGQQEFVDYLAQRAQRGLKFHHVFHQRVVFAGLEVVIVAKPVEHATYHAILKISWEFKCRDPAGVSDSEPEMPARSRLLPGLTRSSLL
jgi:hypothetical protein